MTVIKSWVKTFILNRDIEQRKCFFVEFFNKWGSFNSAVGSIAVNLLIIILWSYLWPLHLSPLATHQTTWCSMWASCVANWLTLIYEWVHNRSAAKLWSNLKNQHLGHFRVNKNPLLTLKLRGCWCFFSIKSYKTAQGCVKGSTK